MPHLQKIYDDADLKEKGLKVYAVNLREDKSKAADFCKQNNLSFPVALDKMGAVGGKYLIHSIPTTVVVGRDGKIKKVFIGYSDDLEANVKEAVNSALAEEKPASDKKEKAG